MPPQASIVILTYNNLDLTRQCLESIFQKTETPEYEIILVDNNSEDGTQAYLKTLAAEHANVHLVLNSVNLGFATGNNQGAALATGEYLVFLNNDTVVTQGWLSGLIRHLQDPQVGMVAPVTNSSGNETRIMVDYTSIEDMDAFSSRYTSAHQGEAFEIGMAAFMCVALRREVFEAIGPLDERFGVGMFEDDDYALRLKEKGYKILCVEDVFIHHWGSATFSRMQATRYWNIFRENLAKFEEKWDVQWTPPAQRPEFLHIRLRQIMDGSIWLSEMLNDQEQLTKQREQTIEQYRAHNAELQAYIQGNLKTITRLNTDIRDLHTHIGTMVDTVNYLNTQLNAIYQSNGWAFLQALLRFRRAIIPENSRREQFLKGLLGFIRNPRSMRFSLKRSSSVAVQSTTPPSPSPKPYSPTPATSITPNATEQIVWYTNQEDDFYRRFPWPLVSVILPIYNHADMLEGAAHSVLHSTYPHLELIILDDGSTDEIEPILQRLVCNPRVRILRQPNQKLPRALTHAHQFARGQFITWTSADNLYTPEALERLVLTLLSHPEAVLAYADVAMINDQGQPLTDGSYRSMNLDPERNDLVRLHRDTSPLGYELDNYINACFLYRRDAALALEGHYADDLRGLEDYDFWLRMQKIGRFQHVGNREPLYFYRVHQRSMSHELVTQQLDPHLKRGENMIDYDAQRRLYANQRWTLALDESLSAQERGKISLTAESLAVDLVTLQSIPASSTTNSITSGWQPDLKRLRVSEAGRIEPEPIALRSMPDSWQLEWHSLWSGEPKTIQFWKGIQIIPLARKARDLRRNCWEAPQAGQRPVVGFHLDLASYPFDLQMTRQLIAQNPWIYFVFVDDAASLEHEKDSQGNTDVPENVASLRGQAIVNDLENAIYLGGREFGKPYHLYSCFDAFWLPPFSEPVPDPLYRTALALAYATARPLLIPPGLECIPAPYQLNYHLPDESLAFVTSLERNSMDWSLLDRYLESWMPASCLEQVLKHADGITQEMALPRPEFGILPAEVKFPIPWKPASYTASSLKCALVVETLDKGGLEEMVAQIARWLPQHGIESFVLCAQSGGMVAERLRAEGIRVHIAEGDQELMLEILNKEAPNVVNTNWAGKTFLEAASKMGVPVIETIHNTYVWYTQSAWEAEKERSRYFTHAIAVSDLVRRYYLKWNNTILPEWITEVPNGIDPQRVILVDRQQARQELGLSKKDFLFITLASYDSRKNHIGLLAAFDELAKHYPQARLLCAGNILDARYNEKVRAYWEALASKHKITLDTYRADTGLLLSAADAFIVDSFFEGWSLAATEALMAGLPLIHSECGSARELTGSQAERGLVVPNPACAPMDLTLEIVYQFAYQTRQSNTEALVRAMSQLIDEREKWESLRPDIRTAALENFTLDHTLSQYVQVFRRFALNPVAVYPQTKVQDKE
jgi:GT2 family glycosyltransferase/glycosyltransferase involved in cell wall biosynthesis